MTAVWELDLPHAEKIVLLALADNANDAGLAFPSAETMARKCGMDERSVRRITGRLEQKGLLVAKERPGRSTLYQIDPGPTVRPTPDRVSDHPGQTVRGTPDGRSDHPGPTVPHNLREESKSKRESARGARLAPDWELTPEREKFARDLGLNARQTFAQFLDYWQQSSSPGAVKRDWDAAWRFWCRKDSQQSPQARAAVQRSEQQDREWDRLRARAQACGFRQPTAVESPAVFETTLRAAEREWESRTTSASSVPRPVHNLVSSLAKKVSTA